MHRPQQAGTFAMNGSEQGAYFPFVIQILQIVVVPLIALIGKQLSDMRKELTAVRERLAHIEGALGVRARGDHSKD
jgi:hypothetical protein